MLDVLIAGAGPTGLVLALWLTRFGVKVRIVDKTKEPGTTSRALGVHARTLEFYRQAGFAGSVVEAGIPAEGVNLWVKGAKTARLPFRRIGEGLSPFPYMLIFPQDDHERLLIAQLNHLGIHVERETDLMRFDLRNDSVRIVLKRLGASEEVVDSAYIAGCDGAHSTVRESLGIGFPGGTYSHLFYVADVGAEGPALDGELHVDFDDTDFLAVFPLAGKGRARLIGTMRGDPVHPDQTAREWTFDDVSPQAIDRLKIRNVKVHWFATYRVHHRVAGTFRKGRAFLLGDAAHIHSPVGAQGMNTGIGDAVNLSWKIAAALRNPARQSVLDSYELERIGFARRLVATTDRIFTVVTRNGWTARWMRTVLVPAVAPRLLRFASVRRWMFRTGSQIAVNYRNSPLSAGAAGRVHGGDRLPWVEIGPHEDNFMPLKSLAWQVHVYGEPEPELGTACALLDIPLHVFSWKPEMKKAGLMKDALYLVRPDGYVALADPEANPENLRRYSYSGRVT